MFLSIKKLVFAYVRWSHSETKEKKKKKKGNKKIANLIQNQSIFLIQYLRVRLLLQLDKRESASAWQIIVDERTDIQEQDAHTQMKRWPRKGS